MNKNKLLGEIIISALFALTGVVVIILSVQYGIWGNIRPDKGFMPFMASSLLCISSIIWFVSSARSFLKVRAETKPVECINQKDQDQISAENENNVGANEKNNKKEFGKNEVFWLITVPVMCLITVFLMNYLGTHISLAVFLIVWLKFISRFSWPKTILYTILLSAVFYGLFTLWLRVPFPTFSLL